MPVLREEDRGTRGLDGGGLIRRHVRKSRIGVFQKGVVDLEGKDGDN